MNRQEQQQHQHPCEEVTYAVNQCHQKHGKQGEDCVREELSQKKCFAQLLCSREAFRFYDERKIPLNSTNVKWKWRDRLLLLPSFNTDEKDDNNNMSNKTNGENNVSRKASCATIVEVFAKPENELLYSAEGVTKDDREYCRKITHELASCLGKKRRM